MLKYDYILGDLRLKDNIPELVSDPSSPEAEDSWVLKTGQNVIPDGTPIGLLLALTYTKELEPPFAYQFSYRTTDGTTNRTFLT